MKLIKKLSCLFTFLTVWSWINAQQFQLKKDSELIKNYQIELIADKNYVFVSENGHVKIPFDEIGTVSKIKILNLDNYTAYVLYREELKADHNYLQFSSGKLIEQVVLTNKKETIIGIEAKGGLMKLYSMPNSSKIVEIPDVDSLYTGKKIKKIRYFMTGGNNTLYNVKTNKMDIRIIPILYTCKSVDCADKKILIPEMEVGFTENSKYLEVNLGQHDIFIDEKFKNLYVGYIAIDYLVVKQKKIEKIGNNKCYNNFPEQHAIRKASVRCPVISVILE